MKRLIYAVILAALITAVCLTGRFTINKICNETYDKLKECQTECKNENFSKTLSISNEIYTNWHKNQKLLAVFVNHILLDNITESFTKLPELSKTKSSEELSAECAKAEYYLNQIIKEHRLTAESFY